jgi:hypothetical protein
MKSCPKCSRTFPDEGQKFCTFDGGLLIGQPPAFDPNATMRATSSDLVVPPVDVNTTSRELPDPNATIMDTYGETVALPRHTGPQNAPNTADFSSPAQTVVDVPSPAPPPQAPPPVTPTPASQAAPPPIEPAATLVSMSPNMMAPPSTPVVAKKKSKLPWIIAAVVIVLLLGGGALAVGFVVIVKPMLDAKSNPRTEPTPTVAENTSTPEVKPTAEPSPSTESFVPPPDTVEFANSIASLDGRLAEHFFDFSFYYPKDWTKDPKAGVPGATNFVGVGRKLDTFPQENFSVGWYTSTGTYLGDLDSYKKRVEEFSSVLEKQFPEYQKVSEGPTTINSMQGYEFRWEGLSKATEKGDVNLWGRVVFLPTGKEGDTTGATLTMFATSLADELSGVDDVGVRGQMPVILESFRFGKR